MSRKLLAGVRILVGTLPPQHQNFAHLLHWRGAGAGAQLVVKLGTLVAVLGTGPDFDQLVRGERAIDLAEERVGQAGMADVDDGFECVSASFQPGAFASSE